MAGKSDQYGDYGSVPNQQPVNGSGASSMGVHADADSFGAQIGAGEQRLGAEGQEVANQFGGMILETAANQAELGYIQAAGNLKAKYAQYEGNAAEAMRPQYQADLQAARSQYREGLPLGAQKAFDSNTIRSVGYQTSEYASYAAGQVKSANLKSHDALMDAAVAHTGDLATVLDDKRFGEQVLAPIIHGGNAVADIHGDAIAATGINPDTGNYSYPDTPEGKAAEARHLSITNAKLASAYETAAKTVADNQGASAAVDWAKKHWDMMPDSAKVKMNQYLAPKMINEDINSAVASANASLVSKQQQQILSNVPKAPLDANAPLSVRNNNPGNLRDSSTGEFRVFNTPEEGTAAMRSDLTAKITGNSPAMEKNYGKHYSPTLSNLITTYAPASENDPKAYIATVSKETGLAPDQVLTTKDIDKLMPAMAKVEAGGASGGVSKEYPNDYERLSASKESFVNDAVNSITQKRGTDLGLIDTTKRRAEANINAQIREAKGKLDSDQRSIQSAIDGSATNGRIPMTVEELRSIPDMAKLVDKVQIEQPTFYGSIITRIAKAQHADATQNSPNAYDAIQATLDTSKPFGRQERIEYLSKGLGTENPGYSISQKDFNDAKPAVDLTDGQKTISDTMRNIAQANGNLDGNGQQRAVQWYNHVMTAYKQKPTDQDDGTFFNSIKDTILPPMPSRMQQLQNQNEKIRISQGKSAVPTIAQKDDRDALAIGGLYWKDGVQYIRSK